jgi:hypothetical protein
VQLLASLPALRCAVSDLLLLSVFPTMVSGEFESEESKEEGTRVEAAERNSSTRVGSAADATDAADRALADMVGSVASLASGS